MRNPSLVKVKCPFGKGDVWIEVNGILVWIFGSEQEFVKTS
jgi:hypothetical protein